MTSNELQLTDGEVADRLSAILTSTSIDLATSRAGANWCSNAFFAERSGDPFRLLIVLEAGGRTLDALRANPNVGVKVVPTGFLEPFAQGVGTAAVRTEPEARDEIFRTVVDKEPALRPFLSAPVEAVEITVDWWRVTHVGAGLLPGRVLERPAPQ
ncbi:hypothetical protein AB0H71_03905 [Nocardia sp. NPDC050697]|uniref:hypothetical protein n=1 Tax=Nocardia sp. NPDC050697 TaxID=3155158 RepID=UPI00340F8AA9